MLEFKTITSQITELGDSVTTAGQNPAAGSTKMYAYLEFADGQFLKKVFLPSGLSGKLELAFQGKQVVELHVALGKGGVLVVALKGQDGRLYASIPPQSSPLLAFGFWVCILMGVPLTFFYGFGLPFLGFAWLINKHLKANQAFKDYVGQLPSAVMI